MTFFDVPLHHNLHEASKAGADHDLRTIFRNTIVQLRPGDAVTFVDNHEYVLDTLNFLQIADRFDSTVGTIIILWHETSLNLK